MIKKIITLTLILFTLNINATAQQPDQIKIDGKKYKLNTNPLEEILKERPIKTKPDFISTGNWRGYIAYFEVKENKLLLRDVTISKSSSIFNDGRYSVIKEIFPEKQNNIIAEWYNGALIVPYGEMVYYEHMGYGSLYENYYIIKVKKGIVYEKLKMNNIEFSKYKKEKFEIFKKSEQYQKEYNKGLNEGWEEANIEHFLMTFYSEYYLSL